MALVLGTATGKGEEEGRKRGGEMAQLRKQREMVQPLLISWHIISHSCLLCQDRLFDLIIPALPNYAQPHWHSAS